MAYAHISGHDTNGSIAGAGTLSLAASPAANNLIVVFINQLNTTSTPTIQTNINGGTNWTINATSINYSGTSSLWFAYTIATGSENAVYVFNPNGSSTFIQYSEFSGNQTSITGIVDAGPLTTTGSGTSLTSANISTATSGDLILCGMATISANGSTSLSWTNGFADTGSSGRTGLGYYIASGTVTNLNTTATWTNSKNDGSMIMAFVPASGGGGGSPGVSNDEFFAFF